jgi:hypothetical protein
MTLAALFVWAVVTAVAAWPFRARPAADSDAALNWINP